MTGGVRQEEESEADDKQDGQVWRSTMVAIGNLRGILARSGGTPLAWIHGAANQNQCPE
jgi:hypothetical protein